MLYYWFCLLCMQQTTQQQQQQKPASGHIAIEKNLIFSVRGPTVKYFLFFIYIQGN